MQLYLCLRPNSKSCQRDSIKLMDVLAQRWTVMCLIMLTVNCQAICETCPQCNAVPLSHLTNTVVLCRLQLITLTTVSFSGVLYQQSTRNSQCLPNLCMLCTAYTIWIYLIPPAMSLPLLFYVFTCIKSIHLWGISTPKNLWLLCIVRICVSFKPVGKCFCKQK